MNKKPGLQIRVNPIERVVKPENKERDHDEVVVLNIKCGILAAHHHTIVWAIVVWLVSPLIVGDVASNAERRRVILAYRSNEKSIKKTFDRVANEHSYLGTYPMHSKLECGFRRRGGRIPAPCWG